MSNLNYFYSNKNSAPKGNGNSLDFPDNNNGLQVGHSTGRPITSNIPLYGNPNAGSGPQTSTPQTSTPQTSTPQTSASQEPTTITFGTNLPGGFQSANVKPGESLNISSGTVTFSMGR